MTSCSYTAQGVLQGTENGAERRMCFLNTRPRGEPTKYRKDSEKALIFLYHYAGNPVNISKISGNFNTKHLK